MRIAVLGLGSWGTALAILLGKGNHTILGWTHDPAQRHALARDRENAKYLAGHRLPESMTVVETPAEALSGAEAVLLAVPSFAVRGIARQALAFQQIPVINAAKGLEEKTNRLMLQVLAQELGSDYPTASLVGPSHAEEVAEDHPTAVVAASRNDEIAVLTQEVFTQDNFRVYTNDDVIGVELAASLKNVIALASGIAVGLGFGDNTAGALLTRGLAEMTRLGVTLNARPETFFGLSGVGDLVTTCASRHSRNRTLGESIGRGMNLEEALAGMSMVAEGVRTTRAAKDLAEKTKTTMPIVDRVHAVLFEEEPPQKAIRALMNRELKPEDANRIR